MLDPTVLARRAIKTYLRTGEVLKPPEDLPDVFLGRAGAFVSLKIRDQLRGCLGSIAPTQANLALEIIHNAINSATRDPRFPPLQPDELALFKVSVDVLEAPQIVSGISELDPKRFGIIVTSGRRSGLLLPDLAGVETVEEQLAIAKKKAGLPGEATVDIWRFRVKRYTDKYAAE